MIVRRKETQKTPLNPKQTVEDQVGSAETRKAWNPISDRLSGRETKSNGPY